jgi:1-deoxy-D-xylulose 5-phosphate reductoisomerase
MKRIALLGATGSIGRQALEIIDAHPDLELVAAASGSQPIDGLAPLTQVGGDATELLERAQPDVVLNAVVGFAGLPATLWALERGIDLALANKESLVAVGEGGFCPSTASTQPRTSVSRAATPRPCIRSSSPPRAGRFAAARARSSRT